MINEKYADYAWEQTAALLAGTSALGGVESRPVSDIIMILDRSAGE